MNCLFNERWIFPYKETHNIIIIITILKQAEHNLGAVKIIALHLYRLFVEYKATITPNDAVSVSVESVGGGQINKVIIVFAKQQMCNNYRYTFISE